METTLNKRIEERTLRGVADRRDTRDGREVITEVSGRETTRSGRGNGGEYRPQIVGGGEEIKPQTEVADGENGTENKPGKGRPKKEDLKLSRSINLKLTKADYETIVSKAAKAKMNPTGYAREMTLSGGVVSRYSVEELDLRRKIAGMANNLNQIAKRANAAGFEAAGYDIADLLRELRGLLDEQ